ncbi:ML domain-containing protein [Xylariales sp. PMI_506]|nr:ML domain-containing protein [Xylariales sp. PMI_506]
MRLSAICVAAVSAAGVASALPGWFDNEVTIFDDALKVPGENPLNYCSADHDDDVVHITNVDLLPNPPEAGANLVIRAAGVVTETITPGAYLLVEVKYGLIRLINQKMDLCEQTEKADLECPIEAGILSITKDVDIPNEVPPGKYTVKADVYTVDDKPITCLQATVTFGLKKTNEIEL